MRGRLVIALLAASLLSSHLAGCGRRATSNSTPSGSPSVTAMPPGSAAPVTRRGFDQSSFDIDKFE
jgi:hypothetical protein